MRSAKDIKRRSSCPISFGLDIFGDKWTLLIIRDIAFYHRTRFSDFAPNEHIATNILTDRLTRLEQLGIIKKTRSSEFKNQNIYSVTQKGKDLIPTLVEMTIWGLQYDPKSPANTQFAERLRSEKRQLADEIAKAIDKDSFVTYRQSEMGITGA